MDGADDAGEEKPAWWVENERIKEELDLPGYEPSRFEDGVYTHRVVEPLEERYDCEIRFVGVNPIYPDDWVVQIDRSTAFPIGRRRDENGNTVFQMDADEFRTAVERAVDE